MDYYLPIEIVRIIYDYDSTYCEIFNKSLNLIKNKKNLPFWNIAWKITNERGNLISTGYGKTCTNYYICNDLCNNYNKDRTTRVMGCKICHYPRFICDGN